MAKAVQKKAATEISTDRIDFGADSGLGHEEADKDAYSIPFLRILQTNSPQCNKADGAYIDGAEAGMLINVATGSVHTSCRVVPCHYRRVFVEWIPQDQGGGFVAEYSADAGKELALTLDDNWCLPNGNQLDDTRLHYCIDADTAEPVVVAMSSTQIKKSRSWMNVMRSLRFQRDDGSKFNPPMFASIFALSTSPESNDKGSWFGWKIEREGTVEDPELYQVAKEFREIVCAGDVSVKHEKDAPASTVDDGLDDEDF